MSLSDSDNGWREYGKLVLEKLDDHSHQLDKLNESVNGVGIELAGLKVKSSIWGLLGGLIPALAVLIYMVIR